MVCLFIFSSFFPPLLQNSYEWFESKPEQLRPAGLLSFWKHVLLHNQSKTTGAKFQPQYMNHKLYNKVKILISRHGILIAVKSVCVIQIYLHFFTTEDPVERYRTVQAGSTYREHFKQDHPSLPALVKLRQLQKALHTPSSSNPSKECPTVHIQKSVQFNLEGLYYSR